MWFFSRKKQLIELQEKVDALSEQTERLGALLEETQKMLLQATDEKASEVVAQVKASMNETICQKSDEILAALAEQSAQQTGALEEAVRSVLAAVQQGSADRASGEQALSEQLTEYQAALTQEAEESRRRTEKGQAALAEQSAQQTGALEEAVRSVLAAVQQGNRECAVVGADIYKQLTEQESLFNKARTEDRQTLTTMEEEIRMLLLSSVMDGISKCE